jgi:hypothetical protein
MANTIQTLDAIVTPTVVALFDESNEQISKTLQYKNLGYSDYEPSFNAPAFQAVSGSSEAVLTLEGEAYSTEDLIQNYRTTITIQKYTKMMLITEELVHWIQKGNKEKIQEFKDVVQACNNGLNAKVDIEAAKLYYLGFGTTFQAGGDGVALFAYNHPSPDSSVAVQRNIFATTEGHLPLTKEALTLALQRLNRFRDIRNIQLTKCMKPKLIIARENEENAKQILMSIQGPLTANLGINPMATVNSKITYEVADWIPQTTYSTYWFLIDEERANKMLYMVWGWRPRVNAESNYSNGTLYKAGSVYFKPGFRDWRFGIGSKGDSSVISS